MLFANKMTAMIYRIIPNIVSSILIFYWDLLGLLKVLLIPKLRVLITKYVLNSFLLSKILKK